MVAAAADTAVAAKITAFVSIAYRFAKWHPEGTILSISLLAQARAVEAAANPR